MTSLNLGNNVTEIGSFAFAYCNNLTEVVFPNSLKEISSSAFQDCAGITSLTFGNSIDTIGAKAFSGCTSLSRVIIPDIESWCRITFTPYHANGSYYYDYTSNPLDIAHDLYMNGEKVVDLIVPNTVTSIGAFAFWQSSIASVTIPNSVISIGEDAFSNCNELAKVIVADLESWCRIDFKSYGSNPLSCAHNLYDSNDILINELSIPCTIDTIKVYAFCSCFSLTSIYIPSSVTYIGQDAIANCVNLNHITLESATPPVIEWNSFNCSNINIYEVATLFVPEESLQAYQTHSLWGRFTRIVPFIGAGPGDINGDGAIDVSDVTRLVDKLLSGEELPAHLDVDGNGSVEIKDLTTLIDSLLGGN
jgi:hypothetical protein